MSTVEDFKVGNRLSVFHWKLLWFKRPVASRQQQYLLSPKIDTNSKISRNVFHTLWLNPNGRHNTATFN